MNKLILFLLFSFTLFSCAKLEDQSSVKVSVSAVNAAGVNKPGGMVLYGHNYTTGEDVSIKFKNGVDTIVLTNGVWDFLVMGWAGPNIMEGTVECGGTSAKFSGGDATIQINITAAKCTTPPTGSAAAKFLAANQFLNFSLNSCITNPGSPTTASSCTGIGTIESYKVKLHTSFVDGSGNLVRDALVTECYDVASGDSNPLLQIPLGAGSTFNLFDTEIEMFSEDSCDNSGAEEYIKFTNGIASFANASSNFSDTVIDVAFDGSSVEIFVESPSLVTPPAAFVSIWQTSTGSETITLPLRSGFTYNFTVDWGDGSAISTVTSNGDPDITHTYDSPGTYTVTINGTVEAWYFNNAGDKDKLYQVTDLGEVGWVNLESAFKGCSNLTTFQGGDTSSVTTMKGMFYLAGSVAPDTSGWDTANVTDMSQMFRSAILATPDTSGWDTSSVTTMREMFRSATNANPNTTGWDTSNVTDMANLFYGAPLANPDTSGWTTTSVTDMSFMFFNATSANPDTSGWDTSSVTDMNYMFNGASAANPDVSSWDTASVTNMNSIFYNASVATPDVSSWDTSSVTDMGSMFRNMSANPNVSSWDTSSVTYMAFMFQSNSVASPNFSSWDTTNVANMSSMFQNATSINASSMSSWNFTNVTNMSSMFSGVSLNTIDYSNLLIQIDATATNTSVTFDGGNSQYDATAVSARSTLTGTDSWTITDFGLIPTPTITSLSTASGPDGTTVTIYGTGFNSISQIRLDSGTSNCINITGETPTQVTCDMQQGGISSSVAISVEVINYDGGISNNNYTFTFP